MAREHVQPLATPARRACTHDAGPLRTDTGTKPDDVRTSPHERGAVAAAGVAAHTNVRVAASKANRMSQIYGTGLGEVRLGSCNVGAFGGFFCRNPSEPPQITPRGRVWSGCESRSRSRKAKRPRRLEHETVSLARPPGRSGARSDAVRTHGRDGVGPDDSCAEQHVAPGDHG